MNPSLNGETIPTNKLSPEAYLRKHHVLTYLEDALSQMVLQENIPRSTNESAKFLSEYFSSVLTENHVMFRGIAFVSATPHNRLAFLKGARKSYQHLLKSNQQLSIQEIHSLLLLLCADMPIELIQRSFLNSGLTFAQPTAFSSFLTNFELQFFLDEFLTDSIKIYRTLQAMNNSHMGSSDLSGPGGSRPGSAASTSSLSKGSSTLTNADSVDSTTFRDRLKQLVHTSKCNYPMPAMPALDEAFGSFQDHSRIKFSHFFNRLSQTRYIQSLLSSDGTNLSASNRNFTVEN